MWSEIVFVEIKRMQYYRLQASTHDWGILAWIYKKSKHHNLQ